MQSMKNTTVTETGLEHVIILKLNYYNNSQRIELYLNGYFHNTKI